MLKARHHWFLLPFFKHHAFRLIRKHFATVCLCGEKQQWNKSVLLVANHISWWDGFWALYLNQKVFKKKFHVMMLEEQLRKHRYFNYCGAYSVAKKSRSIVQSLHYTNELLSDAGNMVLFFPQGEIQSMHVKDFSFEKGLTKILEQQNDKFELVFTAAVCDYFSNKKASLWLYYKKTSFQELSKKSLSEQYSAFYAESLEQHIRQKS